MGRSQVARNQARGRPGSKGGRGGGGRTSHVPASSKQRGGGGGGQIGDLGSNSWRYEQKHDGGMEDQEDGYDNDENSSLLMDTTNYGPSHETIQLRSENNVNKNNAHDADYDQSHDTLLVSNRTDTELLSKALNQLPNSIWMRLPTTYVLNDDLNNNYFQNMNDKKNSNSRKLTLREMKLLPQMTQDLHIQEDDTERKIALESSSSSFGGDDSNKNNISQTAAKESEEDNDGGEEEEDLDAWLDTVI